ncbi:MAG: hypothetical protein GX115_15800 [Ruminiclostridium sp.]|nr:hypothetical protein [Ruminiclostridium sp.]
MNKKDLQAAYIECLNSILPEVDSVKLDKSCNSAVDGYAKEILKRMHDAFVEIYDTDYFDNHCYGSIEVPAVIQGRNTGHICLGIVALDLESSGEHFGTFFLTPLGAIDQDGEKMSPVKSKYLSDNYFPYDYWYTVYIEDDHHVDFERLPRKVAMLLSGCNYDQPELVMK